MELRAICKSELRAIGDRRLIGYAAIFGQLSVPLGNFREKIRPGAFHRTLANKADVRALVDHDPSKLLGRTTAGTLHLKEDGHGLLSEIDLPDTQLAHDTLELVRRGDLSGMSFGFTVKQDTWPEGGVRELLDVDLIDVSVVTFPAYPQTGVAVRDKHGNISTSMSWYEGEDEPTIVIADVTERERLRLRLQLAKQL